MVSSSWSRVKLADAWHNRAISIKAISFALIGLVNTVVDYGVFWSARAALGQTTELPALSAALSVSRDTVILITANIAAWLVAVTGSYIMNSSVTFAVESGRKLHWRAYAAFVGAGIAGLIANTVMLVFGAKCLLLPLWIAKAVAILASFITNFSLSHFVVFPVCDKSRPETYRYIQAHAAFVDDKCCSLKSLAITVERFKHPEPVQFGPSCTASADRVSFSAQRAPRMSK